MTKITTNDQGTALVQTRIREKLDINQKIGKIHKLCLKCYMRVGL